MQLAMLLTTVQPKTLAEKAMLVKLTQNLPPLQVAAHDVEKQLKQGKALRAAKPLYINPKNKLRVLINLLGEQYREHVRLSCPYEDRGPRLLPVTAYEKYMEVHKKIASSIEAARGDVLGSEQTYKDLIKADYDDRVAEAKANGVESIASMSDYLTYEQFKNSIGYAVKMRPLPTSKHPLFDQTDDELADMKAELEKELAANEAEVMQRVTDDLHARMRAPMLKLLDKLRVPIDDPDRKHIFRDSLVENVAAACRDVETLAMGDPAILAKVQEVRSAVIKCAPVVNGAPYIEGLRESPVLRKRAVETLEEVANKIGFMFANGQ